MMRPWPMRTPGSMLLTATVMSLSMTAMADAPARAELSATEVLKKVDYQLTCFNDGTFESKLLIKQPSGQAREYAFTTYQKAPDKRLVKFTAPGDVKGMGFLIENAETMYAYLPGFQKVRRMGTHLKNQSFLGSDFAFDDMSTLTFGSIYDARPAGSEGAQTIVELTQKSGRDLEFPRLKMWVDPTMWVPTKMEFYDASGKKLKTQLRTDYKKDSDVHFNPGKITVIDHRRNDHSSEILFLSTKINAGLTDDLFSIRTLQRGN